MSESSAVFASGAKSSEEKPRYDLIPICALEREAIRMAAGAKAHGENNYQQGKNDPAFIRDRINHLIAHALNYAAGDRSDDHLAAIRANAGMLMWIDTHSSAPLGKVSSSSPSQLPTSGTYPQGTTLADLCAVAASLTSGGAIADAQRTPMIDGLVSRTRSELASEPL